MIDSTVKLIEDLVIANRILVHENVLDGFGHVSVRHDKHPDRYLMTRDLSAGLVTVADIRELDLDSQPLDEAGIKYATERFIHGEIYKLRPDVMAIVHSHAAPLIPFGVGETMLRPIYHMSAFLETGVPIFEIREAGGMTDMLIRTAPLGHALAQSIADKSVVLMRGHGATIVGSSLKQVVYRAIYAVLNAQLQPIAMQLGRVTFLAREEALKADDLHDAVLDRPWDFWKRRALGAERY